MGSERWGERTFDRAEWAALRDRGPAPIGPADLGVLEGVHENLSMDEVEEVYLPLARLLHLRAEVTRGLHEATAAFLGRPVGHVPFVVGIAGSVAVGKSTTARVLRALLSRTPPTASVDLVTTDGFLFPNAELLARGLMERKGFPESYDIERLITFLSDLKAGRPALAAPVYDHVGYDVVEGRHQIVDRPDIVILEGLNVLQVPPTALGRPSVYVSDFFDFSVYVDADPRDVRAWYLDRFRSLVAGARTDPGAFFHRFAGLDEDLVAEVGRGTWEAINLPNLVQNVAPTRDRADLVLEKGHDHRVRRVRLRTR